MTRLIHFAGILLLTLFLTSPVAAQPSSLPPPGPDVEYTVRNTDTMIGLARRLLITGEVPATQRALQLHNRLRDADRINPGQVIRIPSNWIRMQPDGVEVALVQGEVQSAGQAVQRGATLRAGTLLQTGPNSYVTLKLSDGSTLELLPSSQLEIARIEKSPLSTASDASFLLNSGRVSAKVEKRSPTGPRFDVRTPLAVAAVRGTQFRVNIDPVRPGVTNEVLEGAVATSDTGNRGSVDVQEGFGTRVAENAAPLEPRRLLRAPLLWTGPRLMNRRPSSFLFPPLAGAVAYRLTVLRGTQVVLESMLDRADVRIEELENGNYVLRVRGIDDIGLEGYEWSGELWVRVPN